MSASGCNTDIVDYYVLNESGVRGVEQRQLEIGKLEIFMIIGAGLDGPGIMKANPRKAGRYIKTE